MSIESFRLSFTYTFTNASYVYGKGDHRLYYGNAFEYQVPVPFELTGLGATSGGIVAASDDSLGGLWYTDMIDGKLGTWKNLISSQHSYSTPQVVHIRNQETIISCRQLRSSEIVMVSKSKVNVYDIPCDLFIVNGPDLIVAHMDAIHIYSLDEPKEPITIGGGMGEVKQLLVLDNILYAITVKGNIQTFRAWDGEEWQAKYIDQVTPGQLTSYHGYVVLAYSPRIFFYDPETAKVSLLHKCRGAVGSISSDERLIIPCPDESLTVIF